MKNKDLEILELNEIQKRLNDILIHIKRFCKENDIQFFLSNGTLLGAIKYNGFIPWDDDIDILMPRRDYDKFIKLYQNSAKYHLFSRETEKKFLYPFAKLCDMTTIKDECYIDNGIELGIDVDIFPIDSWGESYTKACLRVKLTRIIMKILGFSKTVDWRKLYLRASAKKTWIRQIYYAIGFYIFHRMDSSIMCDEISKNAILYDEFSETKYVGCVIWPVYGKKEIMPKEIFETTITVFFQGEKYPAPAGYEQYLRLLYGDYKNDPPKEKQKSHHLFVVYNK